MNGTNYNWILISMVCLVMLGFTGVQAEDYGIEAVGDVAFYLTGNTTVVLSNGSVVENYTAVSYDMPYIPDNFSWNISKELPLPGFKTFLGHTLGNNTSYTFSTPGVYLLECRGWNQTLDHTNDGSLSILATRPIIGHNITQTPAYNFESRFNFTITSPNSSIPDWFEWKFGNEPNVTSNTTYINHTFPRTLCAQDYAVNVTAYNSSTPGGYVIYPGSSLSGVFPINATPVASFTMLNNATHMPVVKGPTPLVVDLNNTSYSCPETLISLAWNFSDGSPLNTTPNVTKVFDRAGFYNITLNVSSAYGWNQTSQTLIAYDNVTADFTTDPISCPAFPLSVTFRDNSSGSIIDEWTWQFGDGGSVSNITTNTTAHTYHVPGTYRVNMTGWNRTYQVLNQTSRNILATGLFANFTANPPTAEIKRHSSIPASIIFNSTSVGEEGGTLYQWYLGEEGKVVPTSSISRNVVGNYSQAGTYNVSLTITNTSCMNSNTTVKQVVISEILESRYDYSPKYGSFPLIVQFIDKSTDTPVQWSWEFYDKNGTYIRSDPAQNPTQVYPEPGTYRVKLTTVAGSYPIIPKVWDDYITLTEGIDANFTADKTRGAYPLTVNFTDTSVPTGWITNWDWNFSDPENPGNSTLQNPSHTFNRSGSYTVTLTARNVSSGSGDTEQKTGYIQVVDPLQADFRPNGTYAVDPLRIVSFQDLTLPAGRATGWNWNFDDGTPANTTQHPFHQFAEFKVYNVTLTVTDSVYNTTSTITRALNLTENRTPVADFTLAPDIVDIGQEVSFRSTTQGPGISRLLWDFGDGTVLDGLNWTPTHRYTEPGWFDITLKAENQYGSHIKTIPDAVKVRSLIPYFTISPEEWANVGTTVTFTDASKGVPTQWSWDFGDGSLPTNTTSPSITHVFERTGPFNVIMTATNWELVTKSVSRTYEVMEKSAPRNVDFGTSGGQTFPTGQAPLTVHFTDSTPAQANVTSRLWNFGDGSNLIESAPFPPTTDHQYTIPGMYTVSLTVKNENGTSEKTKVVYVVVL